MHTKSIVAYHVRCTPEDVAIFSAVADRIAGVHPTPCAIADRNANAIWSAIITDANK